MEIRLDRTLLPEATSFMDELSRDFLTAAGLRDRRDYSAFYSPCVPSPLLVLNANPGGDADDYQVVDVGAGQHEYIEGYGKTSATTGRILMDALGQVDAEAIRGVQGSNVIWRRSRRMAQLAISEKDAALETQPFLKRMIQHVAPRAILFGGNSAFTLFIEAHQATARSFPDETLTGPNGSRQAVVYARYELQLPYLSGPVDAFVILHPCKGVRAEAMAALRRALPRALAAA